MASLQENTTGEVTKTKNPARTCPAEKCGAVISGKDLHDLCIARFGIKHASVSFSYPKIIKR